LILPFVSLIEEKLSSIEPFSKELDFRIECYYYSKGKFPIPKDNCLCISTIEKANSIINTLIDEKRMNEVGCIIIDELHMIGENERGQIIETLITKLMYLNKYKNIKIQIISMSGIYLLILIKATVPNVQDLSNWMKAKLFESNFRPVVLKEYIKLDNVIYNKNKEIIRKLPDPVKNDPENLLYLCDEVN
jgi:replicative superfamily II helicase